MITIVLVLVAVAAIGHVLVSRLRGEAVNARRVLVLPTVLTVFGGLRLNEYLHDPAGAESSCGVVCGRR